MNIFNYKAKKMFTENNPQAPVQDADVIELDKNEDLPTAEYFINWPILKERLAQQLENAGHIFGVFLGIANNLSTTAAAKYVAGTALGSKSIRNSGVKEHKAAIAVLLMGVCASAIYLAVAVPIVLCYWVATEGLLNPIFKVGTAVIKAIRAFIIDCATGAKNSYTAISNLLNKLLSGKAKSEDLNAKSIAATPLAQVVAPPPLGQVVAPPPLSKQFELDELKIDDLDRKTSSGFTPSFSSQSASPSGSDEEKTFDYEGKIPEKRKSTVVIQSHS